jgi:ADP-heptose:LPS heptosyltransferase
VAVNRPHLVALRALGLGDFLTAVPALRALARAFPDHHRILAAPAWQAPLARLAGAVDDTVHTLQLEPLRPRLRNADVAVNLHGRGPQSTALLAATEPGRLIAFDNGDGPTWEVDEHERDRWCRLLVAHGMVADPDDYRLPVPDVQFAERAIDATVIHPGAAAPARCWPAQRWVEVARAERRQGRQVLLTGAASELRLARFIAGEAGLPRRAVLAGQTDVLELVAVIGHAARLVCADTGVAHIASAVATPSVVLFGPTPPSRWGPPPNGPHIVLWHGTNGDPLADALDPGLAAITVDEVLDALERTECFAPTWVP